MSGIGQSRSKSMPLSYLLLFVIVPLATFWQCLTLPFIQDDWTLIRAFQTINASSLLSCFFDFRGQFFYRPLGLTYLLLLYKLFGLHTLPFHGLALCIHACNSFVVFHIVTRLTGDQTIGLLSGLLYSAAVSVHLDPLSWAVGIYDLAGTLFFLTSILLFVSGRTISSALCFLIGALFKEAIASLPFVLMALEFGGHPGWSINKAKSFALRILPHCVVLGLILFVKIAAGQFPTTLPPSHPYAVNFAGFHVLDNAYRYVVWMLQAFFPMGRPENSLFQFILNDLVILAVIAAMLGSLRSSRLLLTLSFWMLSTLLPVLFLPNHTCRYYATYALPAFICVVLLLFKDILTTVGIHRHRERLLACISGLVILVSVIQSNRIFSQGLHQRTLSDGTNELIKGAGYVRLVERSLLRYLPRPADGATILLGGVNLWAFDKDSGPHVWYKNLTLKTYDLRDLRYESGMFFLENPVGSQVEAYTGPQAQRIYVELDNLHAFQLSDATLRPIDPAELKKIAENAQRY